MKGAEKGVMEVEVEVVGILIVFVFFDGNIIGIIVYQCRLLFCDSTPDSFSKLSCCLVSQLSDTSLPALRKYQQ